MTTSDEDKQYSDFLTERAEAFARDGAGNKEAGAYLRAAIEAEQDEAISSEDLLDVVSEIAAYLEK